MNASLTSFATYQDLVAYIKCLQAGGSTNACYSKGDNGVGASGKTTAQIRRPMVALPSSELKKRWGSHKMAWGKKVRISYGSRKAEAEVADLGPEGVCDLNPAALMAMGWPEDYELNVPGSWEWVEN